MNHPRRRTTLSFCLTLAAALLAKPGEAGEVYSQPPTVGSGYYYTWTSAYTDASLGYYLAFDNFQLSSNATIGSLAWQGMNLNYNGTTSERCSKYEQLADTGLYRRRHVEFPFHTIRARDRFGGKRDGNPCGDDDLRERYRQLLRRIALPSHGYCDPRRPNLLPGDLL